MLVRAMGEQQKLSERVRYKQGSAGLNNGPLRNKWGGRLERKQAPGSGVWRSPGGRGGGNKEWETTSSDAEVILWNGDHREATHGGAEAGPECLKGHKKQECDGMSLSSGDPGGF